MNSTSQINQAFNQDLLSYDSLVLAYCHYFSSNHVSLKDDHYALDDNVILTKSAVIQVIAKIAAFFTSKEKMAFAVSFLEKELAGVFHQQLPDLTLIKLKKYFSELTKYPFLNLMWPIAKNDIKLNGIYNLFLLKHEQQAGLNLNGIVKFVGLLDKPTVMQTLQAKNLPREETKLNTFLLHGDIHRTQFALLRIAMSEKIIDLSQEITTYLQLVSLFSANGRDEVWRLVLDFVMVRPENLSEESEQLTQHPAIKLYRKKHRDSYRAIAFDQDFLFMMDPFYAHAWLMSLTDTCPHLSACFINSFSKSAKKLNQLENELPFHVSSNDDIIFHKENITLNETLKNAEMNYSYLNFQAVDTGLLKLYYESKQHDLGDFQLKKHHLRIALTKNDELVLWRRYDGFLFKKKNKKSHLEKIPYEQLMPIIFSTNNLSLDAKQLLAEFNDVHATTKLPFDCSEKVGDASLLAAVFSGILAYHVKCLQRNYGISDIAIKEMQNKIATLSNDSCMNENKIVASINEVVKNVLSHGENQSKAQKRFKC